MKKQIALSLLVGLLASCGKISNSEMKLESAKENCETYSFDGSDPTRVCYDVEDGRAIFQGDIVLHNDIEKTRQSRGALIMTGAYLNSYSWKNGVVPYTIEGGFPNSARITGAIAAYTSQTNYRFVPRTSETDYVTFQRGSGCYSMIGRVGGQQFITLEDACSQGNTIHEMGHAIGLWHEQGRADRDSYVTIRWENITAGKESAFTQNPQSSGDYGAYDFDSIMHYLPYAFSKNGQPTITRKDGSVNFGARENLSSGDLAAVQALYLAGKTATGAPSCNTEAVAPTASARLDQYNNMVPNTASNHIVVRVRTNQATTVNVTSNMPGFSPTYASIDGGAGVQVTTLPSAGGSYAITFKLTNSAGIASSCSVGISVSGDRPHTRPVYRGFNGKSFAYWIDPNVLAGAGFAVQGVSFYVYTEPTVPCPLPLFAAFRPSTGVWLTSFAGDPALGYLGAMGYVCDLSHNPPGTARLFRFVANRIWPVKTHLTTANFAEGDPRVFDLELPVAPIYGFQGHAPMSQQ